MIAHLYHFKYPNASQSFLTRKTSNSDVFISLNDVNALQFKNNSQLSAQVGQ